MTLSKASLGEALAEETVPYEMNPEWEVVTNLDVIVAAGFVERLLPEKCEKCGGNRKVFRPNPSAPSIVDPNGLDDCPACHGTGQLWDEGLVEVVAKAILQCIPVASHSKDDGSYVNDWSKLADWRKDEYRQWARAVLSALTQEVGK